MVGTYDYRDVHVLYGICTEHAKHMLRTCTTIIAIFTLTSLKRCIHSEYSNGTQRTK